jgi:hypothetical protein
MYWVHATDYWTHRFIPVQFNNRLWLLHPTSFIPIHPWPFHVMVNSYWLSHLQVTILLMHSLPPIPNSNSTLCITHFVLTISFLHHMICMLQFLFQFICYYHILTTSGLEVLIAKVLTTWLGHPTSIYFGMPPSHPTDHICLLIFGLWITLLDRFSNKYFLKKFDFIWPSWPLSKCGSTSDYI